MYQKIENNKEAINKVLEYLKAKTKVQIKLFQVKMTRVSYVLHSRDSQGTSKLPLALWRL